jgi:thiamine-phosphate pyrophosphorylase
VNDLPRRVLISDRATVSIDELERRCTSSDERLVVLVRDKDLPRGLRLALAERVVAFTQRLGHLVWIAEDLELALALGADGVHLGSAADGARAAAVRAKGLWLSVACHSVAEVADREQRLGADSVFLSPIFETPGKGPPLGLTALTEAARRRTRTRLVALGGITAERAEACFDAGADAVAAIRADLTRLGAGLPRADAEGTLEG